MSIQEKIESIVKNDEVVLFMKGSPSFPQCGFSATVVQILGGILDTYTTINVLTDPDIRQGIKEYSNWPTIPQLYIRGEFIGGCDIIRSLHQTGELQTKLGVKDEPIVPPTITVTDAAKAALTEALASEGADTILLAVSSDYVHSLDLGPVAEGMCTVVANGINFAVDRNSAKRANGINIDHVVSSNNEAGFKIDNPNAPATVTEISPDELKAKLDAGEIKEFFDVRTPEEREIASIEGARLLDDEAFAYIESLDKSTPIAFHCHHGKRSRAAAEHFRQQGFVNLYNLAGGIDAWSLDVDPDVSRY